MLDNYLYFHLAPSAQGIPLQRTENKLNLSDSLSRPKRSSPVTLLQSCHSEVWAVHLAAPPQLLEALPEAAPCTSVMWLFGNCGVCFSGLTPPE